MAQRETPIRVTNVNGMRGLLLFFKYCCQVNHLISQDSITLTAGGRGKRGRPAGKKNGDKSRQELLTTETATRRSSRPKSKPLQETRAAVSSTNLTNSGGTSGRGRVPVSKRFM